MVSSVDARGLPRDKPIHDSLCSSLSLLELGSSLLWPFASRHLLPSKVQVHHHTRWHSLDRQAQSSLKQPSELLLGFPERKYLCFALPVATPHCQMLADSPLSRCSRCFQMMKAAESGPTHA